MNTRILIADDHAVVRDGLCAILAHEPQLQVVAQAVDGRSAVQAARRLLPDIVLMDVSMPELNGIDAAAEIAALGLPSRVLMLSMYDSPEHVFRALAAGVRGYLLKESAGAEVVQAIHAVRAGRRYFSQAVADLVRSGRATGCDDPLAALSLREREVLHLVLAGDSSAAIGRKLFLSPKTVETYRSRLMQKLGVRGMHGLIRYAVEHRLMPPD